MMQRISKVFRKLMFAVPRRGFSASNFAVSEEVASCLHHKHPVVALESTIITHGMPYPHNLSTALDVEKIVRKNGAVPATIGVIDGRIHIGMSEEQIQFLASKNENFLKISRRDLPFVISRKLSGGTTVSATMICAHKSGIEVFVTGGIGGVHRGAEKTFDVSADLTELGRTPVTVISAGVKSILDIGLTLEYLETQGVCVTTYGETREFPAFFTQRSGFLSPYSVGNVSEAAKIIEARNELGLENGILIAVPIPSSSAQQSFEIEESIQKALQEARARSVTGKELTPFVLSRVQELSGGASLRANTSLIKNNAHVGSLIAVEYAKVIGARSRDGNGAFQRPTTTFRRHLSSSSRPVVVGGTNLDLNVTCLQDDLKIDGSTQIGKIEVSAGGVGRNMADCLARVGADPLFISVVGADENGATVLSKMEKHMDTDGISISPDIRTASCAVMLDKKGDCAFVIGDMNAHGHITTEQVQLHEEAIVKAPIVVMDGNIPVQTMEYILSVCSSHQIPVWFEPTDVNKAGKLALCSNLKDIWLYASPNFNELLAMHDSMCCHHTKIKDVKDDQYILGHSAELSLPLMEHLMTLVVTLGPLGALLVTKEPKGRPFSIGRCRRGGNRDDKIRTVHYPPLNPPEIISVSGAGDCFAAAMLGAMLHGLDQDACVYEGMSAAICSMASRDSVPDTISLRRISDQSTYIPTEL